MRKYIKLTEKITIGKGKESKTLTARIDTGATQSSIHTSLAQELNLGPIESTKKVNSSHGTSLRPVVSADCTMNGKKINARFNLADRSAMKYKVLIGKNALQKFKFKIDPTKE